MTTARDSHDRFRVYAVCILREIIWRPRSVSIAKMGIIHSRQCDLQGLFGKSEKAGSSKIEKIPPNSVLKIVLLRGVKLFFVILEQSELKHLKVAPDTYQGRIYDKMTTFGKGIRMLCLVHHSTYKNPVY